MYISNPYILLIASLLWLSSVSGLSFERRRGRRGLVFDDNCNPYLKTIDKIVTEVRIEAKIGYDEVTNIKTFVYKMFFEMRTRLWCSWS